MLLVEIVLIPTFLKMDNIFMINYFYILNKTHQLLVPYQVLPDS